MELLQNTAARFFVRILPHGGNTPMAAIIDKVLGGSPAAIAGTVNGTGNSLVDSHVELVLLVADTSTLGTNNVIIQDSMGNAIGSAIFKVVASFTVSGGLTAAQTRTALGMAAADLDDQLGALSADVAGVAF